ncbi:unnamed protein product [Durusdinium trenchii]|uniref:Solute carrier family 40 protein n=1 Tax=Durusdinium trenchii TaxID=1381693 RepID=A0ABP0KK45_9DINO
MMAFVSFGYAISFLHPTQVWAFDLMALSSGMGFVRACLTVHVQACFQDNPEMFTTISKHCGAARNCGSIAAMIVPALLYQHFGWKAVCCGAAAAALLYILLSCLVRRLESPASREAVSEFEPHVEGTCTDISWIDSGPNKEDWMVGSAFIVTELQYNIGNAAIPQTLTSTFIMSVGAVGPTLGSFNATSMIFLALLPTIPWVLLHRSPLNILMSFFLVLVSGLLAAFSALAPDHGLPLFITSILSFTLAINMAQVLMLEYLSGVLDTKGVEKLMGVSETFGCGFAMLGGYVGEELKVFGSSAPFLMQCFVALVTVTTLGASFAHRHVTRDLDVGCRAVGREGAAGIPPSKALMGVFNGDLEVGVWYAKKRRPLNERCWYVAFLFRATSCYAPSQLREVSYLVAAAALARGDQVAELTPFRPVPRKRRPLAGELRLARNT